MTYDEFIEKLDKTILVAVKEGHKMETIGDLKFYIMSKKVSKKRTTLKSLKGLI